MIHFFVKREDERAQVIHEPKDMVKELRDTNDSIKFDIYYVVI